METSIFWTASGVILLLLDLYVLASVWRTTKSTGTKVGWTVLIFLLPLVGLGIQRRCHTADVQEPQQRISDAAGGSYHAQTCRGSAGPFRTTQQ